MKKNVCYFMILFSFCFLMGNPLSFAQEDSGSSSSGIADVQAKLKGTWKSGCISGGPQANFIITSTYDGAGHSTDKVVYYQTSSCAAPTGLVKSNPSVSYKIGPKINTVDGLDIYPIDVTIHSWKLTQNGTLIKSGSNVPTQYDVFAIQENKLYNSGLNPGRVGPITNPANRPGSVNRAQYFTKQ